MGKPSYIIPSTGEINRLAGSNAHTVASTFSGCGGSSLGYKWAGFSVLWANEFLHEAADTYEANHPGTILNRRSIRELKPEDMLDEMGLGVGELDLLDGSPPCSSFSTSGKRERLWGQVKQYSHESKVSERTDDLFFEFTRILDGVQPRMFVAENVAGLVKGSAKGYFLRILEAMRGCGYRVLARVVDAQWLGVPQQRERLIFLGVRQDLAGVPKHPLPFQHQYTALEAVEGLEVEVEREAWIDKQMINPDLPYSLYPRWMRLREGESDKTRFNLVRVARDKPCPAVTQMGGVAGAASLCHWDEPRKFSIGELKRICGFPDDFKLTGNYYQQYERLGRAVPPPMMRAIALSALETLEES